MGTSANQGTVERLHAFLDGLGENLRDKRQRASFATYAMGLLSEGERKKHGADRRPCMLGAQAHARDARAADPLPGRVAMAGHPGAELRSAVRGGRDAGAGPNPHLVRRRHWLSQTVQTLSGNTRATPERRPTARLASAWFWPASTHTSRPTSGSTSRNRAPKTASAAVARTFPMTSSTRPSGAWR